MAGKDVAKYFIFHLMLQFEFQELHPCCPLCQKV